MGSDPICFFLFPIAECFGTRREDSVNVQVPNGAGQLVSVELLDCDRSRRVGNSILSRPGTPADGIQVLSVRAGRRILIV
jgi:hypothetical protein